MNFKLNENYLPYQESREAILPQLAKEGEGGEAPPLTLVFGACPVGEAVWVERWKPSFPFILRFCFSITPYLTLLIMF